MWGEQQPTAPPYTQPYTQPTQPYTQPYTQPNTQVTQPAQYSEYTQAPNTQAPNTQAFLHANWNSGICDCCCGQNANPGFFCLALFCSGIAQGVLLKDLGLVTSCAGPAACYTVIDLVFARTFMVFILTSLRISMSDKLQRGEGPCCSLCCACCCYPCALAQLDRDAKTPGQTYSFEPTKDICEIVPTFFGAIHGRAMPYAPVSMSIH